MNGLTIIPDGEEKTDIDGRIRNWDEEYIYIQIDSGFELLSILARDPLQFFNVHSVVNQTSVIRDFDKQWIIFKNNRWFLEYTGNSKVHFYACLHLYVFIEKCYLFQLYSSRKIK